MYGTTTGNVEQRVTRQGPIKEMTKPGIEAILTGGGKGGKDEL